MRQVLIALFLVTTALTGCGQTSSNSKPTDIDIGRELTSIQDQLKSGFCQSYAFTALLEHRWHQKTGSSLKLSEKSIIRAALRTVIETYWNENEQKFDAVPFGFHIGNVGMSSLLKAVEVYGVVPESSYPTFRVDASGRKSFTFDLEAYGELTNTTSEQLNTAGITKDSFLKSVDELLGIPPEFSVSAQLFSYETFGTVTRTFDTPKSLGDFLEVSAKTYQIVYNGDGFVAGQKIFNPETHKLLADSEARFTQTPKELNAPRLLDLAEKMLDQGVPLVMWNKWQKLEDGIARDSGGHLTVLVGYETLPDKTRWYRVKDSKGMIPPLAREWPNAAYPVRTVDGYTYWERSVLERALMGFLVPSVFARTLE